MPESQTEKAETPFDRFRKLTNRVVSVPRKEIEKREAEWKKTSKDRKHR